MTFFPFGIATEERKIGSSNGQTISTPLSNSRLKYQRINQIPFLDTTVFKRGRIRKKFHLEHQDSSEVDRDSPNYTLRLVPPTRRKIWFIKGKQEDFQELTL